MYCSVFHGFGVVSVIFVSLSKSSIVHMDSTHPEGLSAGPISRFTPSYLQTKPHVSSNVRYFMVSGCYRLNGFLIALRIMPH